MLAGMILAFIASGSEAHAADLAQAQRLARGRSIYEANCMACHDTALYTRKDHTVRSLDGLKQQLEGCSHMAKKEFSPAERQNVVKYLNDRFYRFQ